MSVESEHTLGAKERASIRRGLSMLVDAYEKEMKRVEDNLGSEHGCALLRAEKDEVLELRIKFIEPGSLEEVEAAQENLFDGEEPEEEVVGEVTPDVEDDEADQPEAPREEVPEGEPWPDEEEAKPEPFEGTAAGHLDE